MARALASSQTRDVLDKMEKDALRMADQGYQVASADRYAVPWLAQPRGRAAPTHACDIAPSGMAGC